LWSALLIAALAVFAGVARDYRLRGHLSRPVMALQTGYFCVYARCAYASVDSRLLDVHVRGPLPAAAILLMVLGALICALSMPFLGRRRAPR